MEELATVLLYLYGEYGVEGLTTDQFANFIQDWLDSGIPEGW